MAKLLTSIEADAKSTQGALPSFCDLHDNGLYVTKRNILVTGGAGFIGSYLVDRLLGEGAWSVTVVDDFNDFYSPEIKRANIAGHIENPNYR